MEQEERVKTIVPLNSHTARACLSCGLVKTFEQFNQDGCENCPFLSLKNNKEGINECTTPSFEGLIALINPQESWVAKWKGFVDRIPGCYAMRLTGRLPPEIIQQLREQNIDYVPLDNDN
ncbi:suppressor of ty 4 [Anaeramoeba ignava]|uniref:Suppressor of ty 4 n=1 Tax=Anaeramoeba ignava TaxID=1746090 RepID=A0A9Q0LMR4_ANAIG|nr:suppressor of ty 4 [Anaeramoeba ignava]|eukprot:Anaeramoba_ignava/a107927_29.p1 GENE.a107927_29~~a107927_29.p1  ORF type:complete len:120 (+),score=26.77 a107927_29:35-394(+)